MSLEERDKHTYKQVKRSLELDTKIYDPPKSKDCNTFFVLSCFYCEDVGCVNCQFIVLEAQQTLVWTCHNVQLFCTW